MIPLHEAAQRLNCSPEHLMRLARRGEVQGAKIGRSWTFLEEDLLALVRQRAIVHVAPPARGRRRNKMPNLPALRD